MASSESSGRALFPSIGQGVLSAFVGSALESYLDATLERVDPIDNEVVNFANTLAGGLVAVGIWALL